MPKKSKAKEKYWARHVAALEASGLSRKAYCRKNWTFVGNDRAGRAAATFYSLIETCKLHLTISNKLRANMLMSFVFDWMFEK